MGVGLDRHWLESLIFSCILVRRPALIRLRPYLGRSEAGGEDSMRFPTSACKLWCKKRSRVNGCLREVILLMVRGFLIRTRTRTTCRLCELDETYHTTSQAPFREQHSIAKAKLSCSYVQDLFESCDIWKMSVVRFREHGTTCTY